MMIRQVASVVLALLGMMLSACGKEDAAGELPFPVLNSGVTASTNYEDRYWIDNDRVIFVSYGPKRTDPKTIPVPGLFIWDTRKNEVTLYKHSARHLCFSEDRIVYAITKVPFDPDYKAPWYTGALGEEKKCTPPRTGDGYLDGGDLRADARKRQYVLRKANGERVDSPSGSGQHNHLVYL
jgi:hypothetical protein